VTGEILRRSIDLACPVGHAFEVFLGKIDLWWPRAHRKFPESTLQLEEGKLVERANDGREWVMAKIVRSRPPDLIELDWFPGSPSAPTTVEILFAATGDHTEITITHRALTPAAAEIWPSRVAFFEKGWDTVLPALKAFLEKD
jgi:uncharacterized protein YndB with AHSA1/START domain